MKYLYTLGIVAAVLVVLASGTPEELFDRFFFILGAIAIGYVVLRHRFKLRYYIRLKRAFNSDRHQAKRGAYQYRKTQLQTA